MASSLPISTRSLTLYRSPVDAEPGKVYHDARLERRRLYPLKSNEILVRLGAAAFNHRDLWIRKGMYPGIQFGTVMGADGAGTVVASSQANDPLLNQSVFLVPMRGWTSDPDAPEHPQGMGMLGGGKLSPLGTFSEYVAVERDQVIRSPSHLDDVEMAAWPLAGVTAWRAAMVNARVQEGHNILITGIGGGVAITALQLCVAKGANVYVTSGDLEKITKAIELGAKGGVNYKDSKWSSVLGQMLQRDGVRALDAVIDSSGGTIIRQTSRHLKLGGRIVIYGMTAVQQVSMTMAEVMKNQQIIGSTMGSVKDLQDATQFLAEKRISPVISHVLDGLQNAEQGFELMQRGGQFGKIVIKMADHPTETARL